MDSIFTKRSKTKLKAVLALCQRFNGSGRCITADNFFSSLSLANELWSRKLSFIGTVRSNKAEIYQ
jgi:hypothetical protein